jgi:hypothetical protein
MTDINDGLTDEERAALAINDDEGDGTPVDAPVAEAATPPAAENKEPTDAPKPEDKPAADAGTDNAAAAAAAPAAEPAASEPAAEPAAAPSPAPQPAPVFVADAVENADGKLAEIATQKDALMQRFDDGDITLREYQKQADVLAKQERDIEFAQREAVLAAKMADQQMRNAWVAQAQTFAATNGYTDQRRFNMLDAEVKAVASTDEAKHMDGSQILARAHANLVEAGLMAPKAAAAAQPAAKPAAQKPAVELPPSTHKLPAADIDNAAGGQWADLDRLATTNPTAYEAKLLSMSEAERDRYLASA